MLSVLKEILVVFLLVIGLVCLVWRLGVSLFMVYRWISVRLTCVPVQAVISDLYVDPKRDCWRTVVRYMVNGKEYTAPIPHYHNPVNMERGVPLVVYYAKGSPDRPIYIRGLLFGAVIFFLMLSLMGFAAFYSWSLG